MKRTELLLQRLDEIGETLGRKGGAFLLLGVGSVGVELERMDEYSVWIFCYCGSRAEGQVY